MAANETDRAVAVLGSMQSARAKARLLRSQSAELSQRSAQLCAFSDELRRRGNTLNGDALRRTTNTADDGLVEWSVIRRYLERQARAVGRDPAIEEAKTVITERYNVTRAEAFLILRRLSQRRNQKLAAVAAEICAGRIMPPAVPRDQAS